MERSIVSAARKTFALSSTPPRRLYSGKYYCDLPGGGNGEESDLLRDAMEFEHEKQLLWNNN
jgi:hypothetical protein